MPCTGLVVALIAFVVLSSATSIPSVANLPPSWMRGSDFFALSAGDMDAEGTLDGMRSLPDLIPGSNLVIAQFMYKQTSNESNDPQIDPSTTPPRLSIARFVKAAKARNLTVGVKPLVVAHHGVLMPDLAPSNLTEWFANYKKLCVDLAVIAEFAGADIFSVGVELFRIVTNPESTPLWIDLIRSIRKEFSGKLTYCANPIMKEQEFVGFWNELDYLGVDLYVPLVDVFHSPPPWNLQPSADAMAKMFNRVVEKFLFSWYRTMVNATQQQSLTATGTAPSTNNKTFPPILIAEFGYPSSNAGIALPWVMPESRHERCVGNHTGNVTAQAAAFAVTLTQLVNNYPQEWIAGFVQFWHGQPGSPDYYGDRNQTDSKWACGWTPVGKNATIDVLRQAYKRSF